MADLVQLYEDGAGHLYLAIDNDPLAWSDLEALDDGLFAATARAALAGDTVDWTLPQTPVADLTSDTRLIATVCRRSGAIRYAVWPCGTAGRRILWDLAAED